MYNEQTQKKIYEKCENEGSFLPINEIEIGKIKSMLKIALTDLKSTKKWIINAKKDEGEWNAIFKINYDALHLLVEAFILFDKLKITTHKCLFIYLCEKHLKLELDWNFFEKIRTIRNGSVYYGKLITYKDWEEIQLQLDLYINSLKKEIELKLEEAEKPEEDE